MICWEIFAVGGRTLLQRVLCLPHSLASATVRHLFLAGHFAIRAKTVGNGDSRVRSSPGPASPDGPDAIKFSTTFWHVLVAEPEYTRTPPLSGIPPVPQQSILSAQAGTRSLVVDHRITVIGQTIPHAPRLPAQFPPPPRNPTSKMPLPGFKLGSCAKVQAFQK
jgi:hypothetical protein